MNLFNLFQPRGAKPAPPGPAPGGTSAASPGLPAADPGKSRLSPLVPGVGRIMITDGGAHPAELWAQASAEHIAPLGPEITGRRRAAALALQSAIAQALEAHHQNVQAGERARIAADPGRLLAPHDPEGFLEAAIAAVQQAAAGSEWAAHFADPAVVAAVRQELAGHFATAQHIERSWHADRNPALPAAQAFHALRHPAPAASPSGGEG